MIQTPIFKSFSTIKDRGKRKKKEEEMKNVFRSWIKGIEKRGHNQWKEKNWWKVERRYDKIKREKFGMIKNQFKTFRFNGCFAICFPYQYTKYEDMQLSKRENFFCREQTTIFQILFVKFHTFEARFFGLHSYEKNKSENSK